MKNLNGSCACGKVNYSILDKPLFTQACHCKNCGVYLYCKYNVAKSRLAIRTATLDQPITPQAHIFVKDKDPWIEISNKDICHDAMYDREKTWPQESLDRIKL